MPSMTKRDGFFSIEVASPGPSDAILAHEYPVLESGSISFPEGKYHLDLVKGKNRSSFEITHRIEGAPLISNLLKNNKARCACIVSCPVSCFRKTYISKLVKQTIELDIGNLGEPPLFTPMILCWVPQKILLRKIRDGVHPIWEGQEISLSKGFRLAVGSVFQLRSSLSSLISIHLDKQRERGQFEIQIESEPFRFRVNAGEEIYEDLRAKSSNTRSNNMTHVVTACLANLKADYADDDEEEGPEALRALADFLAREGHPDWKNPEFKPEKVATSLYPLSSHKINSDDY